MSILLRRTLFTAATAVCLSFSAAALGWSFTWGGGEQIHGDGKTAREARKLANFDAISVAGHFEVVVRQSSISRVEVEADGNLLPYIETAVVAGRQGTTLEIGVKRGFSLDSKKPLRIEVDTASLRALNMAGSGKVHIEALKTDSLVLATAGSGHINAAKLEANKLSLSIAGSGDVMASGKAAALDVSIAGSGNTRARDLVSDEVTVSIAGSGDAEVHAVRKLKAKIAGSGSVRYLGDPQVESKVFGSGSVRKL